MLDALELIRELVAIPGPPGCEEAVAAAVARRVAALGLAGQTDAAGNLVIPLGPPGPVRIVVTAHLDEIGLMVSGIEPDGRLRVRALGGLYPWKWGEQPVEILTGGAPVPACLSFGSVHTDHPASVVQQARSGPLGWDHARLLTGLAPAALAERGVRPGCRVALAAARRTVGEFGEFLGSYFLDDRADLAALLLALAELAGGPPLPGVVFAATVSEETGAAGVHYLLHEWRPEVCIALEIGPSVPESQLALDDQPSVWVADALAASPARDMELVAGLARGLGLQPHWQALLRGGSDASSAARNGLTARPFTLGLPVESSHGYEFMHRGAPANLARLTAALVRQLAGVRDGAAGPRPGRRSIRARSDT